MIDCTIDSSTLVDLARGWSPPEYLRTRFQNAGISHVVLGEMLLGAAKASSFRERQNVTRILVGLTILHGDAQTAIIYARIRADLERQGLMIPQNDIWIAAASVQAGLPLVAKDEHFRRIRGLKLIEY